jgi:hypothetical protein
MPPPLEYPCTFVAEGHRYVDDAGTQHESVTQRLTACGCVDFSMVDPLVLKAAAERGTAVHDLSVEWDKVKGGAIPLKQFLCGVPHELHGYLEQYDYFLDETGFVPIVAETERPRLVEVQGVKLAMTPDRIGHFPDLQKLVVLDLKTGDELFSHPLQLAGYSMGIERVMALAMQHMRVALYLEPDAYRLKIYRHPADYYAFLCALYGGGAYLENWKQQRQRSLVR